jgi:formiminotetrahydrofolate cyclodeaminase
MDIKGSSIQAFLDELASSSATPGGGSAAALAGAASAALIGMVCNLTVGRPRFAAAEGDLRAALAQAETLRGQLTALIEADTSAFNQVMAAYRLPKDSDEQQNARQAAIQAALKHATQVPLETATACAAALRLVSRIIAHINPNALSDAGTAAVLAEAGLRGGQPGRDSGCRVRAGGTPEIGAGAGRGRRRAGTSNSLRLGRLSPERQAQNGEGADLARCRAE